MKTLYFLRHANAEPRPTNFADYDRPLVEKGWEEANAVAEYIQSKGLSFDFVMCSSALRARETLEPLRSVINTQDIEVSEKYYNIPEDSILKHLKHLSSHLGSVLYIGHNPGIAFAIFKLASAFPEFLKEGVFPATLVGFHLAIDKWGDLEWGMGELIDLFQPPHGPEESPSPMES